MLENVNFTRLPNGIRVITVPNDRAESAVVSIWAQVGSRYETDALAGASHFIEHLLFKGTPSRSAKNISQAIEGRGGELNAMTGEDYTCYYARLPYEKLADGFHVLADMYQNALLDPDDVERERAVIIEEIRMYSDLPQEVAQEQLNAALWPNHPLGRSIAGSEATVAAMTRDAVADFRARACVPASTFYIFAGRVDHARCVRLVEKATSHLPAAAPLTAEPFTAESGQKSLAVTRKHVEQAQTLLGFRIFNREDPRWPVLKMMSTLLGGNMSSRLFQSVREKHGLCYDISSHIQLFSDTGVFLVSAGFDRSRAKKAITQVLKELDRIRRAAPSETELRRTRDYVLGHYRLSMENIFTQILWAGGNYINRKSPLMPAEFIDQISSVTAADIRCLAGEILTRENLSLSLLLPDEDRTADGVWQNLIDRF